MCGVFAFAISASSAVALRIRRIPTAAAPRAAVLSNQRCGMTRLRRMPFFSSTYLGPGFAHFSSLMSYGRFCALEHLRRNVGSSTSAFRRFIASVSDNATSDDGDDDDTIIAPPRLDCYERRAVVTIVGPANAGKSTLFNRLMCRESEKAYRLNSEGRGKHKRKNRLRSKSALGSANPGAQAHLRGGAIVSSTPGTTRDRRTCEGRLGSVEFVLHDTAGLDVVALAGSAPRRRRRKRRNRGGGDGMEVSGRAMQTAMAAQTAAAASSADLVLLMFDGRVGLTADFLEACRLLRRTMREGSSVRLLANKLEGDAWSREESPVLDFLEEASRAGFGDPVPISAQHGEGMAEIAAMIHEAGQQKLERMGMLPSDHILEEGTKQDDKNDACRPLQLAIIGRQNVGKSTLLNALLGEERVISGPSPGLTRDAISVEFMHSDGRVVRLVDTAGIRKISRRDASDTIEDLSVEGSLRALRLAEVILLVVDAASGCLSKTELALADAVVREGRALVVVANKYDLVADAVSPEEYQSGVAEHVAISLPVLEGTPVVPVGALEGNPHPRDVLDAAFHAKERWERTLSTGLLNRWLSDVLETNPPPTVGAGCRIRIKYVVQTKGRPPTFLLFANVKSLPEHYMRHLRRSFQQTFDMFGMDVRLIMKKSDENRNPFQRKKRIGTGIGGREARFRRKIAAVVSEGKGKPKKHRRKNKNSWR